MSPPRHALTSFAALALTLTLTAACGDAPNAEPAAPAAKENDEPEISIDEMNQTLDELEKEIEAPRDE